MAADKKARRAAMETMMRRLHKSILSRVGKDDDPPAKGDAKEKTK